VPGHVQRIPGFPMCVKPVMYVTRRRLSLFVMAVMANAMVQQDRMMSCSTHNGRCWGFQQVEDAKREFSIEDGCVPRRIEMFAPVCFFLEALSHHSPIRSRALSSGYISEWGIKIFDRDCGVPKHEHLLSTCRSLLGACNCYAWFVPFILNTNLN